MASRCALLGRWAGVAALTVAALVGLGAAPATAAGPTPLATADFSGYSTGTLVHVDLAQSGTTQAVSAEEAFSGASVRSTGASTQVVNEMGQVVQPVLPDTALDPKLKGDRSYGAGAGVQVGLGQTTPTISDQVKLQAAYVSAPPSDTETNGIGPAPVGPVAYADALRGTGTANWPSAGQDFCPVLAGQPISRGDGYAAHAQLVSTTGATNPDGTLVAPVASTTPDGVAETTSFESLVGATDASGKPVGTNVAGLASTTVSSAVPVTLFAGTTNAISVQVLYPLVLQAVAGGLPGSSYVRYAPEGDPSPTTPVLRLSYPGGSQQLTTQQVFGAQGLTIPAGPLATITVGTPPHAIGDASKPAAVAADGTSAAAAVDLVHVTLLAPDATTHVADVRIGHMEARAAVPAGGLAGCTVDVTKTVSKDPVHPGESFTYAVTVHNPNPHCTLTDVRLVDDISAVEGSPTWSVTGTDPKASSSSDRRVVWNDIGPIKPGGTAVVHITVQVAADSTAGRLSDHAAVTGSCGSGAATAAGAVAVPGVPVIGEVTLAAPTVTLVAAPSAAPSGEALATTGGPGWPTLGGGLLLALAAGVAVLRRRASKA